MRRARRAARRDAGQWTCPGPTLRLGWRAAQLPEASASASATLLFEPEGERDPEHRVALIDEDLLKAQVHPDTVLDVLKHHPAAEEEASAVLRVAAAAGETEAERRHEIGSDAKCR